MGLCLPLVWVAFHSGKLVLFLIVTAGISDFLDGYLARKLKSCTTTGKILDPIADKVLINIAFIWLLYLKKIPALLVGLVLAKDISLGLGAILLLIKFKSRFHLSPRYLGKISTAVQLVFLVVVISHSFFSFPVGFLLSPLILLVYTFTLLSWIDYSLIFFKVLTISPDTVSSK
ncbi:MAG: CDP-alcohol phosphatidyltransferase family protein [Thermodesulfobacteria bacterium]|nr:CDP-alcohol phosphatidyltransferase family protein [Thermodesulfobacteriota bacterium]